MIWSWQTWHGSIDKHGLDEHGRDELGLYKHGLDMAFDKHDMVLTNMFMTNKVLTIMVLTNMDKKEIARIWDWLSILFTPNYELNNQTDTSKYTCLKRSHQK